MQDKIIFLNTGWMDFYRGLTGDPISGGGKHVVNTGWGNEMFNFKPLRNKLYGYVQPKIDKVYHNPSIIKLEKIGGSELAEKLYNVTVVWTATHPNKGGAYIVGWYKNATVYRYEQSPPKNSNRRYKNRNFGYYVSANVNESKLLSKDERVFGIRRGKGWMGQSNVWYAQDKTEFIKKVQDYIFKGLIPAKGKKGSKGKGGARQSDPLKRIEVEKKAVLYVIKYYKKLGYTIQSFEKDNVGWDLTAKNNNTELKLEVKGLSGKSISTELTPNEFKTLKADKMFYRLCIVTETLSRPKLKIFAHSYDNNEWTSEDGTIIKLEEVISARISV